ncbi:RagB/SusD family nutrient uptake outer membrane protein [Sphingobacterium sp. HJSM2_6]|uniref:RagB/SusD family nutrient uptake outer membrane protein n=1 Tax=Sphingobacterium sp. HJSM2_6 TaxID=3366264 RepID=UPI003BDC490A
MKKILFSLIALVFLSSCEKFLNVNPENKAYEENLFTDRSGFETALAGVYVSMNSPQLYGREMKFGFLESLVGTYTNLGSSHQYYRAYRHEYGYDFPKTKIMDIWGNLYNVINQANVILKNVETIQNDPHYGLVKGEAIGIKALLHLQLLKLFGPVIQEEGLDVTSIPYKAQVEYTGGQFPTAAEVISNIEADLALARTLMENDPIRTNPRTANLNEFSYEKYNSLIDRRGTRMNYYGIVSLQALVAQWKGDLTQAKTYAEEVIAELERTESSIHLASAGELSQAQNIRLPMENIFALLSQNLLSNVQVVHPTIIDTRSSSTSPLLFPNYNFHLNNLYNAAGHGSLNDFRLLNWFGRISTTSTTWKLVKFIFDPLYVFTNMTYKPLYENKVISLHSLYMIAAEEYAKSNPNKAIEYLNKVRNARNVTNNLSYSGTMTEESIKNLIFDEMRKDNIDEGYMFTEYKRLYKAIHRASAVQPSLTIFKLPIPDDELLYNPQN